MIGQISVVRLMMCLLVLPGAQVHGSSVNQEVIPLQQEIHLGQRVESDGIERWAYVLEPGEELAFAGDCPPGYELVWTASLLTEDIPSSPALEVLWRKDYGDEHTILRWPEADQPWKGWNEFRCPLLTSGRGEMIARRIGASGFYDRIAVVAPRLERIDRRTKTAGDRTSIVLVVFDTFRYDHISRYGAEGIRTPNIDAFLVDAVEFVDAYSRISCTMPSHATMFTGIPPRSHGIRWNLQVLDPAVVTVPQLLYSVGYRTGAIFEIAALREPSGFSPGFDTYSECIKEYGLTVHKVSQWLQTLDGDDFFLFVNLATTHLARQLPNDVWQLTCRLDRGPVYRLRADSHLETMNFVLPPGTSRLHFIAKRGSRLRDGVARTPLSMAMWGWKLLPEGRVRLHWNPEVLRAPRILYLVPTSRWSKQDVLFDGETCALLENSSEDTLIATIRLKAYPDFCGSPEQDRIQYALATATLDSIFGELLKTVERFTNSERIAWIVTSDHGEGLMDHRDPLHGHEVYDETVHVPLGIQVPGALPATRKGVVPLDALATSMLQIADIEPLPSMYANSLLGKPWKPSHHVVSETYFDDAVAERVPRADDQAIRSQEWSLVIERKHQVIQLFRRDADSSERNNILATQPLMGESLSVVLSDSVAAQNTVYKPGVVSGDDELIEALKALGYVQ